MSTEPVIDLEALLNPIPDSEGGAGCDPRADQRFDSPFEQLKVARHQARDLEKSLRDARTRGEVPPSASSKHWDHVIKHGSQVLSAVSKDLEVAAWLAEALAHVHGVAGIRDGLVLVNRLTDEYWDNLSPPIDPIEGVEGRVSPFMGFNGGSRPGTFVERINFTPITSSFGERDFQLWEYGIALEAQRISDEQVRADRLQQLGYSLEDINTAAQATDANFFIDQLNDLEGARAALADFDRVMDQYCGSYAPPTSQIRESLEKATDALTRLGRDKLAQATPPSEEVPSEPKPAANAGQRLPATTQAINAVPLSQAVIGSRQDAIQAMELIARYFKTTEPHSPISYSLDKLVKWANMPLDQLILEWIPESSARETFSLMTGVVTRDLEN